MTRSVPRQLSPAGRTAAPAARGGRPTPRRGAVEFIGARQLRFSVFPGSALAKKPPAALMSAELVETSRLFARMNAAIDPAWAEAIAGDLVKRTVGDPRWEQRQGAAVADERVTLFGVPIVENPPLARALWRLEPDSEIPAEHWQAVAEIIAYVWRLQGRRHG